MTRLIKTITEVKSVLSKCEKPIGFVPTMGALHAGHISLIEAARHDCKTTIVSIFVNPLQFTKGEDFEKYPRDLEKDLKVCEKNEVNIVFVPPEEEIYPVSKVEDSRIYPPKELTGILCGKTRIGHFQGVATVVKRLLDITCSDFAYFGEKDLQQLYIIKWLVQEFNLPVIIKSCPIVREPNGLAYSSRNLYLTNELKEVASNLYKALKLAKQDIRSGIFTVSRAVIESLVCLAQFPEIKVEYFEARDKDGLKPVDELKSKGFYFFVAAKVNGIRLIDNIEI